MELKRKIDEVKYLVTENSERYRKIMRYLFDCLNDMKYWSYSEEIFTYIKMDPEFKEYTLENLKSDLESLVEWKNLIADTDTKKVRTIEEFKNREFKYQVSKSSIEIERMLIRLENLSVEEGDQLNSNFIRRFLSLLKRYENVKNGELKDLYEWWSELKESFITLNDNYTGFISKFSAKKMDAIIEVKDFLIYKEKFQKYLLDFNREAQRNYSEITYLLKNEILTEKEEILEKIYQYEVQTISFHGKIKEDYIALNNERFNRMEEWFLRTRGKTPLMETLFSNTNEIIKKIINYAMKMVEEIEFGYRKEQYLGIKEMFARCVDVEEAHILSSQIFGIVGTTHILGIEDRETENINSSVYDETPKNFLLTEGRRGAANRIVKNIVQINSEEKERKIMRIREERRREGEKLKNLMENSDFQLGNLPLLTAGERRLILKYLDRKQLLSDKRVILRFQDGELNLPDFKIKMEKI